MKIILLILIFTYISIPKSICQESTQMKFPIEQTLTLNDEIFNERNINYSVLDSILKDKKIVLIGDQTHLEGNVTELKIKIIKLLHEKYDFNIILFEDSFYRLKKFNEKKNILIKKESWDEYFSQILAGNQQFLSFINFLNLENTKLDKLEILGFDSQILDIDNTDLIEDISTILSKNNISLSADEKSILQYQFGEAVYYPHEGNPIKTESEKKALMQIFKKIRLVIKENEIDFQSKINYWSQVMDNIEALFQYIAKNQKNVTDLEYQNFRDSLMANNFNYIKKRFPNEKIVAWGAAYHFTKNLKLIKQSLITDAYITKMKKIQPEGSSFTYEIFSKGRPLGEYLDKKFPNEIYALSFTTAGGSYGSPFDDTPYKVVPPPEESIEFFLKTQNKEPRWVDFNSYSNTPPFYISALGHLPLLSKWQNIFDGIIFVPAVTPLLPRSYQNKESLNDETINLDPSDYSLNEVIVESTRIADAESIIKSTIRKKKDNLNKNSFRLNMYYKKIHTKDGIIIKNIEGIVDLNSPYGYRRDYNFKKYAKMHFANILQSIDHISHSSSGIPLLQLYYFDIIADKEGVLNEKSIQDYTYTLEDISNYESNAVYIISFKKNIKRYGSFNNYITKHEGKIYIAVNDLALLKYEAKYSRDSNEEKSKVQQEFSVITNYQKNENLYYLKSGKITLNLIQDGKESQITEEFLTLEKSSIIESEIGKNLLYINDNVPLFNPNFWKNHRILNGDK